MRITIAGFRCRHVAAHLRLARRGQAQNVRVRGANRRLGGNNLTSSRAMELSSRLCSRTTSASASSPGFLSDVKPHTNAPLPPSHAQGVGGENERSSRRAAPRSRRTSPITRFTGDGPDADIFMTNGSLCRRASPASDGQCA